MTEVEQAYERGREDERKKLQKVIDNLRNDLSAQRKATQENFELLKSLTAKANDRPR